VQVEPQRPVAQVIEVMVDSRLHLVERAGLAAVALRLEQPEISARLLGAAEAARAAGFTPTFPSFEQAYRATARLVADAMQPVAFATELDAGRSLSLADIVQLAQELFAEPTARAPVPAQRIAGPLSERDLQVLILLACGQSNAEIASELGLSVRTVEPMGGRLGEVLGVWRMRHPHPARSRHTHSQARRGASSARRRVRQ